MRHEEIVDLLDQADSQMLDLSHTVANLRKELANLVEENNQLRMTNHDLHDLVVEQAHTKETNKEEVNQVDKPVSQSKQRLQSYYDEGIHVCHQLFGARRDEGEECILCLGVLDEMK